MELQRHLTFTMSTIFAQPPIIRGRRKSRGGYQGASNRGKSPHAVRKSVLEAESAVLRHLVANGAPQNPHFDEPTAYYAEKIVEDEHRPPSRQGFRGSGPFSAYAEDFLLHERFEDSEDEFDNPFASLFDPSICFDDHHGDGFTESAGQPKDRLQKQKYDPYIPPQLFSPNFSIHDLPPPPPGTPKNKNSLFMDTATRELLVRADAQFRNHLARVTLASERQQPQTPQPCTPPGLSLPPIPTRKPRVYAPPAVAPPGIPCGPGPIQRPRARPLPHTPPRQDLPPTLGAEPLIPPGLGPVKHHKPDVGPLPTVEVPPASCPGPHILPEMLQGQQRELDAYLNGVREMFVDYHKARCLSAQATRGVRLGGVSKVNLGLAAAVAAGTAAVVPTHFNPLRRVSGAEVWLNVIADHRDRLRAGKRTSKADKKPHYLAMVFPSHSGVVRPARVASPFLLRLETD
ncbi:hypothetical protein D9619_004716 [Psilocybe cf. subviscida]|uniref:Uncharacterized protein n=1 Tax=Psilocybe cf. subviscida TaxID=2480587 RepID=A0A8H5BRD4_9AGAR|nr:hypothetical protein D9619_004716 [Psilocybe cf. subviscida]